MTAEAERAGLATKGRSKTVKIDDWQAFYNSIQIDTSRFGPDIPPKPTQGNLDAFETEHGFKLPKSYRDFILVFGPGELGERLQIAAPGYPDLGGVVPWDLDTRNKSLTLNSEERKLLEPELIQIFDRLYFFGIEAGESWLGWDLNDVRDKKMHEYAIWRVVPRYRPEFDTGSFKALIENSWDKTLNMGDYSRDDDDDSPPISSKHFWPAAYIRKPARRTLQTKSPSNAQSTQGSWIDAFQQLIQLMPPPASPIGLPVDWDKASQELGIEFPEDYRKFIDTYGTGWICDCLSVWKPPYRPLALETLRDCVGSSQYSVFPETGGLLPFGRTGDSEKINWVTKGLPNEWTIVFWTCTNEFHETNCIGVVAFLVQLLTGTSVLFDGDLEREWFETPTFTPAETK